MDFNKVLREFIYSGCGFKKVNNITDSTTFSELGFDSLDYAEFVMEIEEKFDIEIDNNDFVNEIKEANVGVFRKYVEYELGIKSHKERS